MEEKVSLKQKIVEYLKSVYLSDKKKWINRKDMEKLRQFNVYSGHTVTRRCQELAQDEEVDVVLQQVGKRGNLKMAFYRYKPSKKTAWKKYVPSL